MICHGTRGVTVTHLRRIRRVLGSTPGECQFFQLFRCFLSSVLPLRSVGRSNFDTGRHNSNNYVDSKSTYNYNELLYYIVIYIYRTGKL